MVLGSESRHCLLERQTPLCERDSTAKSARRRGDIYRIANQRLALENVGFQKSERLLQQGEYTMDLGEDLEMH